MKLELRNLGAGYGSRTVLRDLSLELPEGQITTLIGANGSGKSTLLKAAARLLKPRTGGAYLDGRELRRWNTRQLARVLAVLPQLHRAPEEITVGELVAYGRFPHRGLLKGDSVRDREAVDEVLQLTRLEPLRRRAVATLSGGERQRVWIAMTLAQEPRVLFLDEPTTFLDVCCQFEVIELIERWNRTRGVTVLMVLHDLNLAARCSHCLVAMKDGEIRYRGTPRELLTPELLREMFELEAEIAVGSDGIPYCIPTGSCRREAERSGR